MYLTKLLQLCLFPFGLVHVNGIVEKRHQITRDFAQLRNLQRNGSRARGLRMRLADAGIRIRAPGLRILDRKDVKLGHCDDVVGQLRHAAEVVAPALVEQEAAPEGDSAGVFFRLVNGVFAVHAEIETEIAGHAEGHAAVHPPLGLSPAAGFADRHQRQRLDGGQGRYLVQVSFHDQAFGLAEEVVPSGGRVVSHSSCSGQRGEVAAQCQHSVDQQGCAVLHLPGRAWRRPACLELVQEQVLGQGGEEAVVPAEVHADEVLHELRVGGDGGPRAIWVLDLVVLLLCMRAGRVGGLAVLAQVDQVRGAANVPRGAILEPQLAHPPAQLALKRRLDRGGSGRRQRADGLVVVVVVAIAILPGEDGVGDRVQALAGAYLLDEGGDVFFGVVQDGLDERLEGRVARLEAVNLLLVHALAPVVRVGVVDALGVVDGGAGGAGRRGAVALAGCQHTKGCVSVSTQCVHVPAPPRTLLFLFLHGTHALEMQRRFLLASSSSPCFFPRRPFFAACCALLLVAPACAPAPPASMASARDAPCPQTVGFPMAGPDDACQSPLSAPLISNGRVLSLVLSVVVQSRCRCQHG